MKKTNILFISILLIGVVFPINGQIEIVDTLTTDTLVRSIYGAETRVKDKDYIALTNELISSNNFSSSDLLDYATYSKYCANVKGQEMSVVYLNNLGICHLVLGNDLEASLKFDKAIEKQLKYDIDHDIEILEFNRAVANVRISKKSQFGDYEDALSQFNTLPQEKFHSNGILYYQGLAEMYKENFSRASKKFIKDISINNSKRSKLSLCYAYYMLGQYDAAYKLLKECDFSDDISSTILFGLVASAAGDNQKASSYYAKLPDSDYYRTDFSEETNESDSIMTQHPTQSYIRSILLSGSLALSGQLTEASELISDESNLTKYGGCYTFGVVEFKLNNLRNARLWFDKAIQLNQDYPHAYSGLAMCKIAIKDYVQAQQYLTQAIQRSDDGNLLLLECRSLLHFNNNNPELGVDDIKSILSVNADYEFGYQSLKNYGFYLINNYDISSAKQVFNSCIKGFPNKSAGYSGLAIIFSKENNYEDAENNFKKASRKEPAISNNHSNLANCLRQKLSIYYVPKLSDSRESRVKNEIVSLYEKAINLDSTNAIAIAGLSSFHADQEKYSLAVENGERAMELASEKVLDGSVIALDNLIDISLLISSVYYKYSTHCQDSLPDISKLYFDKAVDIDSHAISKRKNQDIYIYTNRALFLSIQGNHKEAVELLNSMSHIDNKHKDIFEANVDYLESMSSGVTPTSSYTYYYSTPFDTSPPEFNGQYPILLFQYMPPFEVMYENFPISGMSGGVCNMPD